MAWVCSPSIKGISRNALLRGLSGPEGYEGQISDLQLVLAILHAAFGQGITLSLDIISKCACVSMQSIKDMPVLQDGPPPGGFPSVRYARRIPSTGPAGFTLFAVTASIMAYGFIKVCTPPQHWSAYGSTRFLWLAMINVDLCCR